MNPVHDRSRAEVELTDLEDVLEEIEHGDGSVSPLFADYALTVSAVVPYEHRHDKVPWVHVAGTASDGRDGLRLRAAALGTSVALERALGAADVGDDALRTAMARAIETATAWAHSDRGAHQDGLESFRAYFEPIVEQLGRRLPSDEPVATRLLRGVGTVVHGAIVAERLAQRPDDRNAATIAISSFAQAVHHAAGAARTCGTGTLERVCEGAVHGLVVMAAVA